MRTVYVEVQTAKCGHFSSVCISYVIDLISASEPFTGTLENLE